MKGITKSRIWAVRLLHRGTWAHALFVMNITVLCAYTVRAQLPEQAVTAAPPPAVRAASEYDYPPYCIVKTNGTACGFSVELLRAALKAVHREVTFETGSWSEVMQMLLDGQVDVLPLVGYTPERKERFDFTMPYLNVHGTLVVRNDQLDIQSLDDLSGKRVAVMRGDNAEEFVRRINLDCNISLTETFPAALIGLSSGQYDAVIIQRLLALQIIHQENLTNLLVVGTPLEEFTQSFCFAVQKGNRKLLAQLNEGLAIVIADGTFRRLYSKWFGMLEIAGLAHQSFTVVGDCNYPPFEFLDENGQASGYNVDLIRALARQLGIPVTIKLMPWPQAVDAVLSDQADLLQGMFYSPQRDRELDFSTAHLNISHVIVTRKDAPELTHDDLDGRTILVQAGDLMHEMAQSHKHGGHIISFPSQQDALLALADGQGDCALVTRYTALYLIEKNGWKNLRVAQRSFYTAEYCLAVREDNEALLAWISDGLDALHASGEYRVIYQKWFGHYTPHTIDLRTVLKYTTLILAPLLLLLIALLLWSRILRRQVQQRTADLQHEVSGHIRTAKDLRESENNLQITLDSIGDAVIAVDTQHRITLMNPIAETLTGWTFEHARGQQLQEVFKITDGEHRPIEDPVERAIATGKTTGIANNTLLISRDNHEYQIADSAAPIREKDGNVTGVVLVFRDITEEYKVREELQKMRRLESIGNLAGGIAHDFNNILMGLFGNISMAKLELPKNHTSYSYLQQAENSMERAILLTNQLLTFAKGGAPVKSTIRLRRLVEEIVNFDLAGSRIKANFSIAENLWRIRADKGQIQQVFSNLTINAKEAMPNGGTLGITLENTEVNAGNLFDLKPGRYIRAIIQDQGVGIPRKNLDRIFDPYYTTKKTGSGLGLATTYSIIHRHDGHISVTSIPGEGTTFTLLLPVIDDTKSPSPVPSAVTPAAAPATPLTILVMDDDDAVRNVTAGMLRSFGIRPVPAASGEEAVEIYRTAMQKGTPFDAVITDLTVPGGIDGKQTTARILELNPDAIVIVSSGYASDPIMAEYRKHGFKGCISKPYNKVRLRETLRTTLPSFS